MLNYLGNMRREYHHIKIAGDQDGGFEPALVILNHFKIGRSFAIPVGAIHKYVDPSIYRRDDKYRNQDKDDFMQIAREAKGILYGTGHIVCWSSSPGDRWRAAQNIECCQRAYVFAKQTGILLCTSYNLMKCLQIFEIDMVPSAAAQLLLWIQDGLDQLKNMPPCPEKVDEVVAGEATVNAGGKKFTAEIKVSETEVIEQGTVVG